MLLNCDGYKFAPPNFSLVVNKVFAYCKQSHSLTERTPTILSHAALVRKHK